MTSPALVPRCSPQAAKSLFSSKSSEHPTSLSPALHVGTRSREMSSERIDLPRPESPKPLRKDGFTFKDHLQVQNIGRKTDQELNKLLFPYGQWSKRESKAICKRPWFAAQLKHYGIPCNSSESKPQLEDKLIKAVRNGQVD